MVRLLLSITLCALVVVIAAGCAGRPDSTSAVGTVHATSSLEAESFAGGYSGAAIGNSDADSASLVEALEISGKSGAYALDGSMNDTNREPAMTWTSNSRWHWTGTGVMRDGVLGFTYAVDDSSDHGLGTFQKRGTGFILTLDKNSYLLEKNPQ